MWHEPVHYRCVNRACVKDPGCLAIDVVQRRKPPRPHSARQAWSWTKDVSKITCCLQYAMPALMCGTASRPNSQLARIRRDQRGLEVSRRRWNTVVRRASRLVLRLLCSLGHIHASIDAMPDAASRLCVPWTQAALTQQYGCTRKVSYRYQE